MRVYRGNPAPSQMAGPQHSQFLPIHRMERMGKGGFLCVSQDSIARGGVPASCYHNFFWTNSAVYTVQFIDLVLTLVAAEDNFIQSAKLKFQIPRTGGLVTGIATLGNDLFVIRSRQTQIDVYDAETGTIRRTLQIPYLQSQQSCLAACGFHKCLYVSDERNVCIHKASLIEKSEIVTVRAFREMTYYTGSVNFTSLEVTKNHNLLVARYNVPTLLEYTTDGVLVRELKLHISNPICVTQLPTGLYGVIHQDAQSYRYSMMDTNGEVIKHSAVIMRPRPYQYHPYGQAFQEEYRHADCESTVELGFGFALYAEEFPTGSTVTHDAEPSGLTVSKSGTVFIGSRVGNKILVLCETGDGFKVEFLPDAAYGGRTLNQPHCVHFDDSKKRLYIGEGRGGRVLCCSAERK